MLENKSLGENLNYLRIEDIVGVSSSYPMTNVALARDRILIAKEYPHDVTESWAPIGYDIIERNIISGEEKIISRLDYTFIYPLSDGNTFYLAIDEDISGISKEYVTHICRIDPETYEIEWLLNMETQEAFHEKNYDDFIISDSKLFMIADYSVLSFDLKNRVLSLLYHSEEYIDNSIRSNHAFIYEDELYLSRYNKEIFAINIHSGKERILPLNYDQIEHRRYFDPASIYRYFRYKDKLFFKRSQTKGFYAYYLKTGEEYCVTDAEFFLISVGSNGLYVGKEENCKNIFFYNPDTSEIHLIKDLTTGNNIPYPLDSVFEEIYRREFAG